MKPFTLWAIWSEQDGWVTAIERADFLLMYNSFAGTLCVFYDKEDAENEKNNLVYVYPDRDFKVVKLTATPKEAE